MKRVCSLLLVGLLLCGLQLSAAAEVMTDGTEAVSAMAAAQFDRSYTRFNDFAETVSEEEEAQLNAKVRVMLEPLQMDFPVCVYYERQSTSSLEEFAADFYARNKFGCGEDKSGILLVLDLKTAKFGIYYYGEADTLIGEAERDALSDTFKSACRNDELTYYDAFDRYYDAAFAMVEDARANPTTTAVRTAPQSDDEMPEWYPEETEGFQDFHGENLPPVVDDAHIFTEEQMQTLSEKISAVTSRLGIGYAAFTSDNNHGLMPEEYSSDFLHFNGYGVGDGYGAVVFYLSLDPEDRCWLTTSINTYEDLFTYDVTYEIDEMVDSSIRGGEYYEAFLMHADYVEQMFSKMSENLPQWYPAGTHTYELDRSARSFAPQPKTDAPRVTDDGGMLSAQQMKDCENALQTLSQQYGLDLVIFTDSGYRTPKAAQYAEDFYYYNGYGQDGIILYLFNGDTVQFDTVCYGKGEQYESLDLAGELRGKIRKNEPDQAIALYTERLTFMLEKGRLPMHLGTALFCVAVGVIVGLIAAAILMSGLKRAMKISESVSAFSYLVSGSFRLISKSSHYLYSTVTRTAKPKETTSSGSSGGSSRGGSSYSSGRSAGGSYSSGGRRF